VPELSNSNSSHCEGEEDYFHQVDTSFIASDTEVGEVQSSKRLSINVEDDSEEENEAIGEVQLLYEKVNLNASASNRSKSKRSDGDDVLMDLNYKNLYSRDVNRRLPDRFHHRKGQPSFDVSDLGTLKAGGFEISRRGVTKIPSLSHARRLSTYGTDLHEEDLVKLGELGRGQNGCVMKAFHIPTISIVALKTLSAFSKDERHQLVKELSAFYCAHHPHLVSLMGASFAEGQITLGLEYCNRGSLDQIVEKYGPIQETTLRSVARHLMSALAHLGSLHMIHRDIKPANMLITSEGTVKISDFGLVKQLDGTQAMCATFVGTQAYLSPERILGEQYTAAADIWSIGISLIYLARGELALPKDYWALIQLLTQAPPTLTVDEGFSEDMCHFVNSCLQHDADKRPSATTLLTHPWLQEEPKESTDLTSKAAPWTEFIDPPQREIDLVIDAMIRHYYSSKDELPLEPEDFRRIERIANQFGCHPNTIQHAFIKRFRLTKAGSISPLNPESHPPLLSPKAKAINFSTGSSQIHSSKHSLFSPSNTKSFTFTGSLSQPNTNLHRTNSAISPSGRLFHSYQITSPTTRVSSTYTFVYASPVSATSMNIPQRNRENSVNSIPVNNSSALNQSSQLQPDPYNNALVPSIADSSYSYSYSYSPS
jgi:serine/threonine protein kinase